MKALIHLHPRLSYLCEAAFISNTVFGAQEFLLLEGPSAQSRKTLNQFTEYLVANRNVLVEILPVERIRSYFAESSQGAAKLRLVRAYIRAIFSPQSTRAMQFAARDSLITKRWRYIYLLACSPIKRFLEHLMQCWGEVLRLYYVEVLEQEEIGCVVLSHPSYIPFLALIEASIQRGITCVVIGNGVVYKIGSYSDVYNARSVMNNWVKHYEYLKKECTRAPSLGEHRSSLGHALGRLDMRKNSRPTDERRRNVLIIFTHCVRDCNHIGNPSRMLFENYFDWLVFTATVLATKKSRFDEIVFKMHPASQRYGDRWFLSLLANIIRFGRNSQKVKILSDDESLGDLLDGRPLDNFIPVTFHGSIALESACLGIKAICAGQALAPVSGAYFPDSRDEYMKMLLKPASATVDITERNKAIDNAFKLKAVFSWSHFPDYITSVSKKLDGFYYFGDRRQLISEEVAPLMRSLKRHQGKSFLIDRNKNDRSDGMIFFR